MKRKILRIGKASLAVSIPSKWAKAHDLKPGEEIELEENDGGVFFTTSRAAFENEITINAPEGEHFIRRVIISPYIQGYNTIHIHYKEATTHERIMEVLNHLMGFEVISESPGRVTIKNVARGIEEEFDALFQRMFHLVNTIGETILKAVKENKKELLDEVPIYEHMLNKLHHFCRRILNTQSNKEIKKITAEYSVISDLEGISDTYTTIARRLKKKKTLPDISEGLERTIKICKEVTHVYAQPTIEGVSKHRYNTKKANEWFETKAENTKGFESTIYTELSQICRQTRELTIELAYPFSS